MFQRNHFFLLGEMYLGVPEPIEDELLEQELDDEPVVMTTPWVFDFGLDKTMEFEQHAKGPTMHWYDHVEQTKSIGHWLDLTQTKDVL